MSTKKIIPAKAQDTQEAECKPSNPKDIIGSNKLPLHLFPTTAIAYGSLALLDGAMKYGRGNFRSVGVKASIYYDACQRHMNAWIEGQNLAEDSALPHLAHALACIAILIEATEQGNLNDDRNHKGEAYLRMVRGMAGEVQRIRTKYSGQTSTPKHYTIDDNS